MRRTSQRAIRPAFDDLEGRQLLSTVLPGNETSPSAPAIATFDNGVSGPQEYIAWRGTGNNSLNVENLATGWMITFGETTSVGTALE